MDYSDLFLDTNVLLDHLLPNRKFHQVTTDLLMRSDQHNIRLNLSVSSVCTLSYFLEKHKTPISKVSGTLNRIADAYLIVGTTNSVLRRAASSNFKDLEDAILYFTAVENACKAFITQNTKDFPEPHVIPVYTPTQMLKELNVNH